MASPSDLSLHAAADLLARGDLSSRALCEALMARRTRVDAGVRAYLYHDDEAVLRAADEADARRRAGKPLSRCDGIPVALKDNLSTRDQPCTCASRILAGYIAPYDATAVARLRAAGMIPAGRTNMDEFAMGSSTENSGLQQTANPWNPDHVPGGSSGGSAAAVAAREATAALGSDTGGSIRQPAGFCGVVGLKPTYGRVSRYGLVAYASSLDQIGPITRDVRDAAILLDLIAGPDPRDATALPDSPPACEASLAQASAAGLRVGLPREYFEVEGLAPEVRAAVEAAADCLRDAGAALVTVSLPRTRYAIASYYIIATAEASANLARFDSVRYGLRDTAAEARSLLDMYRCSRAAGFGPEVKRRIILGTYVLSSGYYDAYYRRAQQVRTLIRNDFLDAFAACDVMLAPVAPTPAFRAGQMSSPLEMYLSDIYTISANLAGIPGISVPWTHSGSGLPIGVQILGPALGEIAVLRAAALLEQASGGTRFPDL